MEIESKNCNTCMFNEKAGKFEEGFRTCNIYVAEKNKNKNTTTTILKNTENAEGKIERTILKNIKKDIQNTERNTKHECITVPYAMLTFNSVQRQEMRKPRGIKETQEEARTLTKHYQNLMKSKSYMARSISSA